MVKNSVNGFWQWAVFFSLTIAIQGCSDDGMSPNPELEGGVLATFRVEGETFRLWTTNPTTIADLFALKAGTSQANIPNGPILPGAGQGDHNHPWTWHIDPEGTVMAENTIEVCSGTPSYVESTLADWLALGQYCPWGAVLVKLRDFR
jgi:hypothetical protein